MPMVLASVVGQDPGAPALVRGETEISYADLDGRSSQLARELIGRGAGPGGVVTVALPRSEDAALATWAVLKTGAALRLIDPAALRLVDPIRAGDGATGVVVTSARFAPAAWANAVVLDDQDTARKIAAHEARPVGYGDRTGPLTVENAAIVFDERELSQGELVGFLASAAERYEINYESRSYLILADERYQLLEVLLAASAGAALVFAETDSADDVGDVLVDEWVTHVFSSAGVLAEADITAAEDLSVIVLTAGIPADAPGLVGCPQTVHADPDPWPM
jgi:non-ribosomal peptide synthetase component F